MPEWGDMELPGDGTGWMEAQLRDGGSAAAGIKHRDEARTGFLRPCLR